MTKDEERAVLERAAKVLDEWRRSEIANVCCDSSQHYALTNCAAAIRSLPLESKESEAEPVCQRIAIDTAIDWWWEKTDCPVGTKLYTTPQPCPKCAELEDQHEQTMMDYRRQLIERGEWQEKAEAAEKHAAEETIRCLIAEEKIKRVVHQATIDQERVAAQLAKVREECAQVCMSLELMDTHAYTADGYSALLGCARAIRALKGKP